MTIAELRGKISDTGANLSERMEDLLTANTFGCMRYVPPQRLLIPFLSTARSFRGKDFAITDNVIAVYYSFWPSIKTRDAIPCEPDVMIVIDPPRAKIVEKMYEWYSTGSVSMLEIRRKLKTDFNIEFSKGFIDFILKNPFYTGIMLYNGKEYPHRYENIVSEDLFHVVQQIKAEYNKKHFKFAGLPYLYRGLIRCAVCGCMITPEKKKGKYVYYHCTEYYGKHGATWIREEEITDQFAQVFKSLQVPKDIIEQIVSTLRSAHKDKVHFHRTLLDDYRSEYQKYQSRIEGMYEDKLDGSITESFYNKKREEYRIKQIEIADKISRLSGADDEYYITSEYLLQLANRAYDLFLSSEAEEKRQIIKLTLQNLKLEGKMVTFELVKPFDKVFACSSSQGWLPG